MSLVSKRIKYKYIIPDINTACTHLAQGISKDLDECYKSVDYVFFDIVIEQNKEHTFSVFILDNRYKLSQTILDTDEGKEAVIIPMNIRPLKLDKFRALKIEHRYSSLRRELNRKFLRHYSCNVFWGYFRENSKYIKLLNGLVKGRE